MPVIADLKVIPQHIRATYDLLIPFFKESEGGGRI